MHDSSLFRKVTIHLKMPKEGPLEEALRTFGSNLLDSSAEFHTSHFKELQKSFMPLHRF